MNLSFLQSEILIGNKEGYQFFPFFFFGHLKPYSSVVLMQWFESMAAQQQERCLKDLVASYTDKALGVKINTSVASTLFLLWQIHMLKQTVVL